MTSHSRPARNHPARSARRSDWLRGLLLVGGGLAASILPASAGVQATLYVAPNGSGSVGSLAAPCTLTAARDLVRGMNGRMSGDIVVYLRGGVYRLTAPFQLLESATVHDSGTGGFNVIYRAYPGETPILSGGLPVTGWTLFDQGRNLYRAKVDPALQTRQFYVNERRAVRARGADKPKGWTKTPTGWEIADGTMQSWRNPTDIEIVARSSWKHLRCGIASITGTTVTMKTPGWTNCSKSPHPGKPWNGGGTQEMRTVEWVENAYELLSAPGQWYLDRGAGYLYYLPLPGENMATAAAVAPTLETLLDVRGSGPAGKIHNVEFVGLTFQYGGWLQPSGDQGYADNQGGVVWVNVPPVSAKTPGNLSVQYARDVRLERNVIAHMGGTAIDCGHAAERDVIVGNCIYDVSGNGIFLGDVDDYAATDPAAQTDANVIKDNYVTRAGVEYEDEIGIEVGYARHTLIDHNEVADLPYSGISVGWGWGKDGYSYRNLITNNYVHDYMKVLGDGGGIYTLGNQGDAGGRTVWSGNCVRNFGHSFAQGYYPDEGSGWMELKNNVVLHNGANWLYIWNPSIHDVNVHGNFSDNPKVRMNGTNCQVTDNVLDVKAESLPEAAQAIMRQAGLEPAYANVASPAHPAATPPGRTAR